MTIKRAALLAATLAISACGQRSSTDGATAADHQVSAALQDPSGWAVAGGTALEQHYGTADEINASNVKHLGLAWSLDLDTDRGQEATPIIVGGVIYTTTAWSKVIAVNALTGKLKWEYDPEVPGPAAYKGCCDVVNRGAAFYDGKIYFATFDGRLIALDAATGKPVWSVLTVDQAKPYTITGAPRIARGKVIIGNGGADLGVRGYVTAYDAQTGKQVWRFYTVPGDPAAGPDHAASDDVLAAKAKSTWFGNKYWTYGGGGTVWDAIVYDEELNRLYIGVGNGSPWNQRIRSEGKGDNLFLSSIVALDPDTGKYLWHYQETPGETWDFTATQPIILADVKIAGTQRKVLMHAPKNGFFYVLDRNDGKLISAKNFVPTSWATSIDTNTGRPVETSNARYLKPEVALPGSPGAHNWQPMAFSPKTGLVYIPAQSIPFLLTEDKRFQFRPGRWNTGVDLNAGPLPNTPEAVKAARAALKGSLIAWDPVAQKAAWTVQHDRPVNGGVLATGGGLVFQGQSAGQFAAYDAANGHELWKFDTQSGVIAAPMTYKLGGQQYVAVLAGYGGAMALALPNFNGPRPRMNGRLLVFKLGGKQVLPPKPEVQPPSVTQEPLSPTAVLQGQKLFADNCSGCHAAAAMSSNVVPDLRRSGALPDAAAWKAVLIDGVLSDRGMISFKDKLNGSEIESIRSYVQMQARAEARRNKP